MGGEKDFLELKSAIQQCIMLFLGLALTEHVFGGLNYGFVCNYPTYLHQSTKHFTSLVDIHGQ